MNIIKNDIKYMPILIVDDYKTMLRIIRNLLSQIGFDDVDEALDGHLALPMLRKRNHGLIISDWNMEPMSGLQLLKEIRTAQTSLIDVPFLMIMPGNLGESYKDMVSMRTQYGPINFIVKPFNAHELKVKLVTVLGNF